MSSKTFPPRRALSLIAVLAAVLALPAFAGAATTHSMKWDRSVLLENPTKGGALDDVSCAPTPTAVKPTLLCVAGDPHGRVWVTEHPAQSSKLWHEQNIDPDGGGITGISCPSTKLCVAVDANGQVLHSTDPLGGAKDWTHPARVDTATQPGGGFAGFSGISCPTTQLCVAVDNSLNGQVAYTTNPTGPAKGWTLATIGTGVTLNAVACATATMCVIGGSERYYSIAPTGGASAWKPTGPLTAGSSTFASLTCNTVSLCVGVGYGNAGAGLATATATPSGAAGSWIATLIGTDPPSPGAQLVDGVSCPYRNLCVAVDGASNAYTTTTPVRGGWSKARPLKKASQATLSAISCNIAMCVEVDNRGTVTYGVVKGATTTTTGTTKTTTGTTTTSTKTTTTKTTSTG